MMNDDTKRGIAIALLALYKDIDEQHERHIAIKDYNPIAAIQAKKHRYACDWCNQSRDMVMRVQDELC